ncbi:hypothetical protein ACE1SV_60620 [Streptomyces sp. E-15]
MTVPPPQPPDRAEAGGPPRGTATPRPLGRDGEIDRITRCLTRQPGGPQSLLLLGEEGIGRTTLLRHVRDLATAHGMRVLSAAGWTADRRHARACLRQLLAPVLDEVPALPDRHGRVLTAALDPARADARPDDAQVRAAVLALLDRLAGSSPLLVTVDDAHECDPAFLEALCAGTRSLTGRAVRLLLTARGDAPPPGSPPDMERLHLDPLGVPAAAALLDRLPAPPAGRRRLEILEEAAGNPLALMELGRRAPVPARAGLTGAGPARRPSTAHVFGARLDGLPPRTGRALLYAAAAAPGESVAALMAALDTDDLTVWAPAEAAGLVTLAEDRVVFRHPLARSAAFARCTADARHRAHRDLARTVARPQEAARHRAAATLGTSEPVAAALEDSAWRRGDAVEAARALERAARLSPRPRERTRRLAEALVAAQAVGDPAWVRDLYGCFVREATDPEHATDDALTSGGTTEGATIAGRTAGDATGPRRSADSTTAPDAGTDRTASDTGTDTTAPDPTADTTTAGPAPDATTAPRPSVGDARLACAAAGALASVLSQESGQREAVDVLTNMAEHIPEAGRPVGLVVAALAAGVAFQSGLSEHRETLATLLDRTPETTSSPPPQPPGAGLLGRLDTPDAQQALHAFATTVVRPPAAVHRLPDLGRPHSALHDAPDALIRRLTVVMVAYHADEADVRLAELRKADAHLAASRAFGVRAWSVLALLDTLVATGRFAEAESLVREAADEAAVLRLPRLRADLEAQALTLLALRGTLPPEPWLTPAVWRAVSLEENRATHARLLRARGLAAITLGDWDESWRQLRELFTADGSPLHPFLSPRSITELAVAAQRTGRSAEVVPILARVRADQGERPSTRMTLLLHHATALTGPDHDAEQHYQLALVNHEADRWPWARAHARLDYAVWLRRHRRTVEARRQLTGVLETAERLGAGALAAAAARQLRASGAARTPRTGGPLEQLTAQQRQIVQLAADGLSNREIGEQLFLSPRTVGSHLYQVYPKLGVSRRHQLRDLLEDG